MSHAAYYDLDDILASHEKLPCTFNVKCKKLNYLVNQNGVSIDVGTMLELPLWLAMPLLKRGCVDLRVPRCFAQAVRNDIQAGPNSVDLNALSPYFYDFATRFLSILDDMPDFAAQIDIMLKTAFPPRLERIMDHTQALSSRHGMVDPETESFQRRLDQKERKLYAIGSQAAKALERWTFQPKQRNRLTKANVLQ